MPEEIVNKKDLAWKNRKIFMAQDEIFGIPAKIFGTGVAASIAFGVAFKSLLMFLLTAGLYFWPMHYVHKKDPRGLRVWRRALARRHNFWCAGRSEARRVVILSKYQN